MSTLELEELISKMSAPEIQELIARLAEELVVRIRESNIYTEGEGKQGRPI